MAPIHIRPDGEGIAVPHEATDGVIAFVEQSMAPRHLITGHIHHDNDVWIYVLDGEVGVRVGDEEATGSKGDYLLKPRGIPHAMWNPGNEPNRFIEVLTPGNDKIFRGQEDDSITWFDDWTDELRERYGVDT